MDDRTVVCPRPLVSGLLGLLALLLALGAAPETTGPAEVSSPTTAPRPPLDRRPYAIRAWVSVDPRARLDDRGRAEMVATWRELVRRFIGAPWSLDVAEGPGPLATTDPDGLSVEILVPLVEGGLDKLWMIQIGPDDGDGYVLSGRAYDVATRHLGPVRQTPAPYPSDAARALLGLSQTLFTPSAQIGPSSAGGVSLTVQGASLTAASPAGTVVQPGTAFVPVRVIKRRGRSSSEERIDQVSYSYLVVESVDGPTAHCAIASSWPDPLSRRIFGLKQLLAVGVKPAGSPTRFRFLTVGEEAPAAGYTLTMRTFPKGVPREVGLTDREGRIAVPAPEIPDGPVVLRLLAANVEPLVEFPIMPGETDEERILKIDPHAQAVALEALLNALKDDVVDQVAQRAQLDALLEARLGGEAWDEIRRLLAQYRRLPARSIFVKRLEEIKADAERQQAESKSPVMTKTVQAQLADAESLILRYLDDEAFQAYENALSQHDAAVAGAAQKAQAKAAAPKAAFPPAAVSKPAPQPEAPKAAPAPAPVEPAQPPPGAVPF